MPLIDRLRDNGYHVELACAFSGTEEQLSDRGYIIHNIPFRRKLASIDHLKALVSLYRLMKQKQYHVVHVHTEIAAVIARIAAKVVGVPVVLYTAHGFYIYEGMNKLIRIMVICLEKLLGEATTDYIFAVSKEAEQIAKRHYFLPHDRVIYIGNGVNLNMFADIGCRADYRISLGLSGSDKVIGYVGRIVKEKGVLDLLEAFRHVREHFSNAKLLIIGDTLESDRDKSTKEEMIRMIAEYKLEPHVVLTGFRDDVPVLLKTMDIFVLPSYREGLPISLLEAMASSLPVVATDISGCREAVENGVTGILIPVKQPVSLANELTKLLLNPDLAKRMGAAGRERVISNYNLNDVIAKQVSIYNMTVGDLKDSP